MDEGSFALAGTLVDKAYVLQGQQAIARREGLTKSLLSSRKIPAKGWDDASIEHFLSELALMDSNNFLDNAGVGEREGRVFSQLVLKSRYRMSHGIGRSGDIAAIQPKAAGSSLMAKLVNLMALDALAIAGITEAKAALTVPLATGMALTMTLLGLRLKFKCPPSKRVVLWSRIDQKSCFKAIVTAGFEVVVVPLCRSSQGEGDELSTDLTALETLLTSHAERVLCVVTTASCFAPRAPDDLEAVARLCKAASSSADGAGASGGVASGGVAHVVNNAYGLQCAGTMRRLARAMRVGRVDAVVQSTDKNFLVPVGGAVIAGADKETIEAIGQAYPGRASAAPLQDLFITLLSMGADGYRGLLREREGLAVHLRARLVEVAAKHGERVLDTPNNSISFGLTLDSLQTPEAPSGGGGGSGGIGGGGFDETYLGSMLFTRCVSGTRVVRRGEVKTICGVKFTGFGSSFDDYPHSYLTAACAIGVSRPEIDRFIEVLDKSMTQFKKRQSKEEHKAKSGKIGGAKAAAGGAEESPKEPAAIPIETDAQAGTKDLGN